MIESTRVRVKVERGFLYFFWDERNNGLFVCSREENIQYRGDTDDGGVGELPE